MTVRSTEASVLHSKFTFLKLYHVPEFGLSSVKVVLFDWKKGFETDNKER